MNAAQWDIFRTFRDAFKEQVAAWSSDADLMHLLQELQGKTAAADKVPAYPLQTPIVYNTSLDQVTADTELKVIVIGDNPGKDEQLAANRKYLVGLSGKVANTWFSNHPELGIDFRANTIILNKTPVHSAKTKELNAMSKLGGPQVADLILETQLWMARQTAKLHADLCAAATTEAEKPLLWLVGYAELKGKGVFIPYRNVLSSFYTSDPAGIQASSCVGVYQHFSMNRFFIDVKDNSDPAKSLQDNLIATGLLHRKEILAF